jgi:RecA-family ATPase
LTAKAKPKLLIGDTLSDIFAGAENDRMQAKQFVKMMRKLVVPHGGTGLILAHPSVDGMRSGTGSAGSTGWNNALRWRGYLERVLNDDGSEADESRRVLRTKKANYGKRSVEIELRWHNGCFQVAGSETVATMDPLWKERRADRVFLDLLAWNIKNNNFVCLSKKAGELYAPKVFRKEADRQGVTYSELEEAMTRLLNSGQIENVPYGPTSRGAFRLYIAGMSTVM